MSNNLLILPAIMAVADLAGTAIFAASGESTARRVLLTYFGLGFALLMVLADLVPDAVEHNPSGWPLLAAGVAVGAALTFKAGHGRGGAGKAAAIGAMALHNLCEGMMLAVGAPALSALMALGAIAHKLPEGMVVFSLAERAGTAGRWAAATASALLIPLGAWVALPPALEQSLLAFAGGVLFVVLFKELVQAAGLRQGATRGAAAAATAIGAALAGLSTLVV